MKKRTEYDNIDVIGNTWEDDNPDSLQSFNKYDKKTREKVVSEFFKGEKRKTVLDMGCSIGPWYPFFKKQGATYVVGVDISKELLLS